jgi:hypothetical protein
VESLLVVRVIGIEGHVTETFVIKLREGYLPLTACVFGMYLRITMFFGQYYQCQYHYIY